MHTPSIGHILFQNGSVIAGNFSCDSEQLEILSNAIRSFSSVINKDNLFSGEISLVEFLHAINQDESVDHSTSFVQEISNCLLNIHQNSVTIH